MISWFSQARVLTGAGLSLLVASVALGPCLPAPTSVGEPGPVGPLTIGQQGVIAVDLAVAALEVTALEKIARDGTGRGELAVSGRGFLLPFGTKVVVMERTSSALRVRVLDGPRAGQDGWVPRESVRPEPNPLSLDGRGLGRG